MQIGGNCVVCKGAEPERFCGRAFCPIYAKAAAMFKIEKKLDKEDFSGSSPAPFVGRYGYPNVNVGILSPPERTTDAWVYDAPSYWAAQNFAIPAIIDLRSALINSRFKMNIKQKSRFLELSQEIAMASRPVEVEISLEKKPKFRMSFEPYVAPMGPNAKLKSAEITSNPKISSKVEKVVDDIDLKASNALIYLTQEGFDENFLSKLLSVGTLGIGKNRKLVPTRFSITAVDDTLGKNLIKKVKDYSLANYQAFFGGYLGNYFLVLLFPEVWSFELFEMYQPRASWNITENLQYTTDYELYTGRKYYADNCGGGYYGARLPILEKLGEIKKQASVLVLRVITGEYAVPLGVFVVREAVRKAMDSKPISFASKELLLNYARLKLKSKFGINADMVLNNSVLLREMKSQSKLSKFMVF